MHLCLPAFRVGRLPDRPLPSTCSHSLLFLCTQFGAFMQGVELFDVGAYGLSAAEAAAMDPQHRWAHGGAQAVWAGVGLHASAPHCTFLHLVSGCGSLSIAPPCWAVANCPRVPTNVLPPPGWCLRLRARRWALVPACTWPSRPRRACLWAFPGPSMPALRSRRGQVSGSFGRVLLYKLGMQGHVSDFSPLPGRIVACKQTCVATSVLQL